MSLFVLIMGAAPTPFQKNAFSQDKVLGAATLNNVQTRLFLSPFAILQKDPTQNITPHKIIESGGTVLNGKTSPQKMLSLGYDGTPVWITIKITNEHDEKDWYVDFGKRSDGRIGSIDRVNAYDMSFQKIEENSEIKTSVVLNPLQNQSARGSFKISIEKGQQKFLLLNIIPTAGRPSTLPVYIEDEASYLKDIQEIGLFNTVYNTILAVFALFFLCIAAVGRNSKPIIFGLYFLFMIIFWLSCESLGGMIGFKGFGLFITGFTLAFTLFTIFMTKVFCNVGPSSYTEKYIIYGLALLNIFSSLLFYFLPIQNPILHLTLFYGAPILTLLILILFTFAQFSNNQNKTLLFTFSCIFPLCGLVVHLLSACGFLPLNNFYINAFWYSIIAQGLFLIMAVVQKIQLLERKNQSSDYTLSPQDAVNFSGLRETKEKADHTRLLKVIERERELLAELREKEAIRVEEMMRAKEEADEANRAKSAFLAVVSHEIRTPMTGVMGMVKLLLDSNINKQQRDHVLTIQESSEAMLALLNDILDFEKIQRGKMELEEISFDLHRLVQGVVALMSGHAAEKSIGLSARIDDDLPKFVKGDPTRLRQVLLNLMGNAIKFTQKGNVTLIVKNLNSPELEQTREYKDKYMIYFAVQDSGIGIPPEAQRNLFSPFSQANSGIARKFGGTGLGLAISKGLIEAMGSTVNISSKENEGSTFFFTLEMKKGLSNNQETIQSSKKSVPVSFDENALRQLKILVVDDNAITRKVVMGLLQNSGHEIITATSGEDALEKIHADAFDLVFMDIEMGGMSGNEATKKLREHPDPVKSKIPVIALTGNVQTEDIARYLADGMTDFIGKPIDPDRLMTVIFEVMQKNTDREIRMPSAPMAVIKIETATVPITLIEKNIFDESMLKSLKDTIGKEQLDSLLIDLLNKTDEILNTLEQTRITNNLDEIAARAHELKGMAGNFGLVEISDIAAQIERKAKTGETNNLDDLIKSLPQSATRAKSTLKQWAGD